MLPRAGGWSDFPLSGQMKKSRNRSEPGRAGRAAKQKAPAWQNREAGLSHRRGRRRHRTRRALPTDSRGDTRPPAVTAGPGCGASAYPLPWLPPASEKMTQVSSHPGGPGLCESLQFRNKSPFRSLNRRAASCPRASRRSGHLSRFSSFGNTTVPLYA